MLRLACGLGVAGSTGRGRAGGRAARRGGGAGRRSNAARAAAGAARAETLGSGRRRAATFGRARRGKPRPLQDEEAMGRDAQGGVVMEAAPSGAPLPTGPRSDPGRAPASAPDRRARSARAAWPARPAGSAASRPAGSRAKTWSARPRPRATRPGATARARVRGDHGRDARGGHGTQPSARPARPGCPRASLPSARPWPGR